MHVRTHLGYVHVARGVSGWWEVQRGPHRAASQSLPRALRFVGLGTPEARAVAGEIRRASADQHALSPRRAG